jgi:hypothetical protein
MWEIDMGNVPNVKLIATVGVGLDEGVVLLAQANDAAIFDDRS